MALVTGGASGIGAATAELLAERGAAVCVVDLDEERGTALAERIGGRFLRADVGDHDEMHRAVDTCVRELGGLDVAFLNAGIGLDVERVEDLDESRYRRIMRVNVDGVTFGMMASVAAMRGTGGAIVATASVAGLTAYTPDPFYTGTKHYVVGLVRSLGAALEHDGITVNCVCPGIVDTPLVGGRGRRALEDIAFPLIPPRDVAQAVVDIVEGGGTGQAWVCQPGREPVAYRFPRVPGPRVEGLRAAPPEMNYTL